MSQHEKNIDEQIKETLAKIAKDQGASDEDVLNMSDRVRLIGAGLTFNTQDEIFAGFQSLISDKSYDELVGIERRMLNKARDKDGSLKYEMAGALAPALVMAPFTAGTSIPITAGRLAVVSGASGLASSIGSKEGDIVERITENVPELVTDTAVSTVAGPILGKGTQVLSAGITKLAQPVIDKIKGQLGKKVEDEIIRIAQSGGLTADEVIEGVATGKTFTELNPEIATEIRAIYAKGGGASGSKIRTSLEKREKENVDEVVANLQKGLAPKKSEGNILEMVQKSEKELKKLESDNYKSIFAQGSNLADNELDNIILQVVNKYKPAKLTNDINTVLKAEGLPKLFNKTDDGFELTGNISLETGEQVYRIVRDQATKLFRAGSNTEGNAVKNLSLVIKAKLDDISPDLKATRAKWSEIENATTLFKDGSKLLGKQADEAEIDINAVMRMNNPKLLESFREGIAQSIRNKISGSPTGKGAFIRRLNNPESKERIIINKIFPSDQIDDLIKGADRASGSMMAKNKVLGGSPTQITAERGKNIGTVEDASNLVSAVSGDLFAGGRLLRKFFPSATSQLSPKQLEQVTDLAITENKDLLVKALNNAEARENALNKVTDIINKIVVSEAVISGQQVAETIPAPNLGMSARAEENNDDITNFVSNIPMSARMKILNSLDMT